MHSLKLLLSALISSWQFFKDTPVAAKIEFALLKDSQDESFEWQEFSLEPEEQTPLQFLLSLFFNPVHNEAVYIADCAELIFEEAYEEKAYDLQKRIQAYLLKRDIGFKSLPYFKFRVSLDENLYISQAFKLLGGQA